MKLFICCAIVAVAAASDSILRFENNDKACEVTFEGSRLKSNCAIYTPDK
jgi:hypothetical protein